MNRTFNRTIFRMDAAQSPNAAELPSSARWQRVAARTAGICGAALAAQLPPMLLVGWPLVRTDLIPLVGNLLVDYGRVALVVALTLHAVERTAGWRRRWRHALLVAGLTAAVTTQLIPGTGREFTDGPQFEERLGRAGINYDERALRLYQIWFSAILAAVSAIYLMQLDDSIEAEQRRRSLTAQWHQARRRVRIMHDAAGAARLDPQVLFDCLGVARSEYLSDAARGDALLDRLIDFLRGTLSGTRTGHHTLDLEMAMATRFAAVVAGSAGVQFVDAVPSGLRHLEVCPGVLLSLVQQWLAACAAAAGSTVAATTASRQLQVSASVEGKAPRLLCLCLSGPSVATDGMLAESRKRLADLYGHHASVQVAAVGAVAPRHSIHLELPLDHTHVA